MTISSSSNKDADLWRPVVRENESRTEIRPLQAPRSIEQDRLKAMLGRGSSVIVYGDAGVGKTQLITRTLSDITTTQPDTTIRAAYIDAPDTNLAEALDLKNDIDFTHSTELIDELTSWLRSTQSSTHRLILRIEDAHLLDERSSQAVSQLIQNGTTTCILSMRSAAVRTKPWSTLLHNGCAQRLELRPFTRSETEAFLEEVLGGPVTADSAWRLWQHTRGNPYHIAELVNDHISHSAFFEIDGVWMWDGKPQPDPQLHDIIADDMNSFTASTRALAETLALIGPIATHLVYDLAHDSDIADLDRRGLLSSQVEQRPDGTREQVTGLMHNLYASAVRSRISAKRRREILNVVNDEISPLTRQPQLRPRFVELAIECGYPIEARWINVTMRQFLSEHRPRTAVKLATAALETVEIGDDYIELLLHRAEAWRGVDAPIDAQGDLDTVRTILDELPALAWPHASQYVLDHARISAAVMQYHYDRPEEAVSYLQERYAWLESKIGPDEHWKSIFERWILTHQGYSGNHELVIERGTEILRETSENRYGLVPLATPVALAIAHCGDLQSAIAITGEFIAIAYSHLDKYMWGPSELIAARSMMKFWAGELDELNNLHRVIHTDMDPALVDRVSDHLGRALKAHSQGSWATAAREYHAANARFAHADMTGLHSYSLYSEALATAAAGNSAEAWGLLEKADTVPRRTMKVIDIWLDLLRVETLSWLRDKSAIPAAQKIADSARQRGFALPEIEALHRFIVRSIAANPQYDSLPQSRATIDSALQRLNELRTTVQANRPHLLIDHANAMVAHDDDHVAIIERELTKCGLWLPPMREPVELTRREREIAVLAAGGMSSKAIADRLVLSVRTVDSHLSRVFTKTGIHSREELSRILR